MKKALLFFAIIGISLIFINCGEPEESVWHYITVNQGEELMFQLDAVTKWDTIYFSERFDIVHEPEHAEFYEIFAKDGDPSYYYFLYVAGHDFLGEDYAQITLSRDPNNQSYDEVQTHLFYITVVER